MSPSLENSKVFFHSWNPSSPQPPTLGAEAAMLKVEARTPLKVQLHVHLLTSKYERLYFTELKKKTCLPKLRIVDSEKKKYFSKSTDNKLKRFQESSRTEMCNNPGDKNSKKVKKEHLRNRSLVPLIITLRCNSISQEVFCLFITN